MITLRQSNIFNVRSDAIVHQANCFHTMGGGIAKEIKRLFPEAYLADLKTEFGGMDKLGTFSKANFQYPPVTIYNLYSQFDTGVERMTNYEALYTGLERIKCDMIENAKTLLTIPHGMGCGLAGGNWKIVNSIVETIFEDNQVDITICKYTPI